MSNIAGSCKSCDDFELTDQYYTLELMYMIMKERPSYPLRLDRNYLDG